jgi:hypothetical protein
MKLLVEILLIALVVPVWGLKAYFSLQALIGFLRDSV